MIGNMSSFLGRGGSGFCVFSMCVDFVVISVLLSVKQRGKRGKSRASAFSFHSWSRLGEVQMSEENR